MTISVDSDEKIILDPRAASWYGPGEIGISEALFLDAQAQANLKQGQWHEGNLAVTDKKIAWQGKAGSKECEINFEDTKRFLYEEGSWVTNPMLLIKLENNDDEKFVMQGLKNNIVAFLENARKEAITNKAKKCEEHLDFDEAVKLWEKIGNSKEAGRIRGIKAEQSSVKVTQKVVHGDEVTNTEVKDSVINKSNIGSKGDDKLAKLKELKELYDSGILDDEEFKQMKKDILGK